MRHMKAMLLGAALMANHFFAMAQAWSRCMGWGQRDNDDRQAFRMVSTRDSRMRP